MIILLQCNEVGDKIQPDIAPATPAPKSNILSVRSPRYWSVKIQEEDEKNYDDVYDSDVEQGTFFDAIDIEGEQDFDEDEVVKEVTDCSNVSTDSEDSMSKPPIHEDIPPDAMKKLKVSYLKEEINKRGKSTVVIKKVILERLEIALKNKVPLDATTANKKQVGN